jgi:hypothetical protein
MFCLIFLLSHDIINPPIMSLIFCPDAVLWLYSGV